MLVRIASFIFGTIFALLIFASVVDAMLISRSTRSRLDGLINSVVLSVAEAPLRLMRKYQTRDRWLTGVAPVSMLIQLSIYAFLFILALGLMIYGTTDLDFWNSMYQSGSTFTTLGIVEPTNAPSAIISFIAAFLGLVVIAVFIGYLLSLYGMYADRETAMARLSSAAGEPAWGPEILARISTLQRDVHGSFGSTVWVDWITQIRMNTGVNPVLALFRSTSSQRHWVISMLAVIDAASIRLALGSPQNLANDINLVTEGAVTLGHLNHHSLSSWEIEKDLLAIAQEKKPSAVSPESAGLTSDELTVGFDELVKTGVLPESQRSAVESRFIHIRAHYFADAYALAYKHHAIRAPWSGTRKYSGDVLFPARATNSR